MHKYFQALGLITLLFASNCIAYINHGKPHDYRDKKTNIELVRMQDFHLKQAHTKIQEKLLSNAWGDLAYIICQVPNHHLALQQMLHLAPLLRKESEMQEYLAKAVELYPDDDVLQMLYGAFLHNIGDTANAKKYLELANQNGEFNTNDSLLKNPATNQQ